MKLTFEQIMNNSFVVTIDNERFAAFEKGLSTANIPDELFPRKYTGYEITDEYLLSHFRFLKEQAESVYHGLVELNISLVHALCNNASHVGIVQLAKFTNMPFVTIFEDDATPVENCVDKINKQCENIPDDTDVLRLGYIYTHTPRAHNYIGNAKVIDDNLIQGWFAGSHAYIVFSKYYDRFIEKNKLCPRCDYGKINPSEDKVVYDLKESVFRQCNIEGRPVIHSWKFANGQIKLPTVG